MLDSKLTRRGFLHTGRNMLVGTLALNSGALALLAPGRSWALPLTALDSVTGRALLKATRHIFPHDNLDDAVYALVVKQLDNDAGADKAVAGLLKDGVLALNEAAGGDWLALAPPAQFAIIEKMAGDDFFEKIRGTAVVSLYNNDMAWAYFGYEGDAWNKGGYLARGFNDLNWLPDPPVAASPAVFGA